MNIDYRLSLFISYQPLLKNRGWWNRIARRVTWPKKVGRRRKGKCVSSLGDLDGPRKGKYVYVVNILVWRREFHPLFLTHQKRNVCDKVGVTFT